MLKNGSLVGQHYYHALLRNIQSKVEEGVNCYLDIIIACYNCLGFKPVPLFELLLLSGFTSASRSLIMMRIGLSLFDGGQVICLELSLLLTCGPKFLLGSSSQASYFFTHISFQWHINSTFLIGTYITHFHYSSICALFS